MAHAFSRENMSSAGGIPGSGAISRTMAAVIAVVAVVAIVGTAATVIVLTGNTPTGTVRNYLQSVVGDNPGNSFNDTVWSLNKTLYRIWAHEAEFESNTTLTIRSLTEITKSEMTVDQRSDMNRTAHIIEDLFNVTVQNYCFVKYNITLTATEHNETETHNATGQFKLVQVKGNWLIVVMMDDLEEAFGSSTLAMQAVKA